MGGRSRGGGRAGPAHILGPPAIVAAVAVLILRALAEVPLLVQPCPGRGAGEWSSVGRAEAELGVSLWLPSMVSPQVIWPPRRIACLAEAPLTVLVVADLRHGPGAVMEFTQVIEAGPRGPAAATLSGATTEMPVALDGGGTLQVERGPDGRTWRRVTWAREGRRLTLRAPLEVEEVLRAARSVGPPAGGREGT